MSKNKIERISVYLSYLLRHDPDAAELKMDRHGWVVVSTLIKNVNSAGKYNLSLDLLKDIVERDNSFMNRITTQQFQRLSASYMEEQARLEIEIPKKEAQLTEASYVDAGAEDFICKAKRYTDITKLTTEILQRFIEKLVVHEKEQRYSRYSPQTIEIYYNGIGCIGATASAQSKSA